MLFSLSLRHTHIPVLIHTHTDVPVKCEAIFLWSLICGWAVVRFVMKKKKAEWIDDGRKTASGL